MYIYVHNYLVTKLLLTLVGKMFSPMLIVWAINKPKEIIFFCIKFWLKIKPLPFKQQFKGNLSIKCSSIMNSAITV